MNNYNARYHCPSIEVQFEIVFVENFLDKMTDWRNYCEFSEGKINNEMHRSIL